MADGVFTDASDVYLSEAPDVQNPDVADPFCVLTPREQVIDQGIVTGGGRTLTYFESEFTATVWSRLALDAGYRKDAFLTDANFGILPKVKCVMTSLQMYQPVDSTGAIMISEPMRLLRIRKPELVDNVPGWGTVVMDFWLAYTQCLSC